MARVKEEEPAISAATFDGDARSDSARAVHSLLGDLLVDTLEDLEAPSWQRRHGASLALLQLITNALPMYVFVVVVAMRLAFNVSFRLPTDAVEQIAIRVLQVLALDRFNDFITGANAVAPVRESLAQTLAALVLRVGANSPLAAAIYAHIRILLAMLEENVSKL